MNQTLSHLVYMRLLSGLFSVFFLALGSCQGPYKIYEGGVGRWELGSEWPPVSDLVWKGNPVQDTVFEEEGYTWEVQVLSHKEGRIYLEEDFFGSEVLNRIRVESSKYKHPGGIRVGMTWEEVAPGEANWYATWLEAYRRIDVIALRRPGIHFLFMPEGVDTSWVDGPLSLQEIPEDALLTGIVVM